jgi:hypothetical protein
MPNHVTNVLTIENVSEERLAAILAAVRMDDMEGRRSLDFNKIIPMPDSVYQGNLGQAERQSYGENNWYDWAVKNWGTKWNSYDYDSEPIHDGANQIEFMTAWSEPMPVIERLSQLFPDAQFRHAWADEDIGANAGEILYQNGEHIDYDVPSRHSKEAYEMTADIMCFDLRENGYRFSEKGGNYRYSEGLDLRELRYGENYYSGVDFQCDQTGGYPSILCWNQDACKAWLEPASVFDDGSAEAKQCHKDCGEWGVRPCCSWEDYNALLESLGEDAAQTSVPNEDETEEFGGMSLS